MPPIGGAEHRRNYNSARCRNTRSVRRKGEFTGFNGQFIIVGVRKTDGSDARQRVGNFHRVSADEVRIADTYREEFVDDGICGLCKFDSDHGLDEYANERPGFGRNHCFAWRGPGVGEGGQS